MYPSDLDDTSIRAACDQHRLPRLASISQIDGPHRAVDLGDIEPVLGPITCQTNRLVEVLDDHVDVRDSFRRSRRIKLFDNGDSVQRVAQGWLAAIRPCHQKRHPLPTYSIDSRPKGQARAGQVRVSFRVGSGSLTGR